MKRTTIIMFILLLTVIWGPGSIYGKIPGKERDALRTLFNDTGGDAWRNKKNWKGAPGTEDSWYGITCNQGKTTVLKIDLPYNNLKGTLPSDLGALSNLTTLNLSNNRLTGPIPRWIGELTFLKKLDLSHNQFTGRIPPWIGNLKNLEELVLDDNMLQGPIPGTLGSLSKLKVLRLGSNRLTGEIPTAIGKLGQLLNNGSDFKWNGLYTPNARLKEFLNRKQTGADWESTQTVPPLARDIKVVAFEEDSITIGWGPIKYTGDSGSYRVYYRQDGKPYDDNIFKATEDKTVARVTLKDLEKSTKYYFKIQTRTGIHSKNRNPIESISSKEFSAATRGIIISGTVTKYIDMKKSQKEPFQGVQMKASDKGGTEITDKDGKYSLNIMPGWRGTVTPVKEGFDFSPPGREYPPVKADISDQAYTAAANTMISGKVTYKGEGVAGVELTFSSKDGKSLLATTDENGYYVNIVPYNWTGTVTPKKEGHRFEPRENQYLPVTSHLKGKNYTVLFPGISGRVTNPSGKTGIDGVKLVFSNVETGKFSYLKEYAVTDANGNYSNEISDTWIGSVTPKKSRYIFYPATSGELKSGDAGKALNFKAERDFRIFISVTGNYMISSESLFKEVYGSSVLYPEITTGFKFGRNFYLWGGFGLFSKSGKSTALKDPAQWKQVHLSLGLGYYKNLSIRTGWKISIGAVSVRYGEEGLGEDVSYNAIGVRIETAGIYKLNKRFFTEISLGYLHVSDTIEDESIKPGGLRAGIGLGLRF